MSKFLYNHIFFLQEEKYCYRKKKMGKVKALKHNANKGKQQLHEIKGGSIKKNKDSKFKNTPKGKVALINNSIEIYRKLSPKVSSGNKSSGQKPTPTKNKVSKKYWDQKSSPNDNAVAKRSKQDSPNKKQNFKQNTNSNKGQRIDKKTFNPKKVEKQLDKPNSNTIESEDDSLNKSDETSESDSDIPDILGKSLGDETDDEDYEEEEEDTDNDDDSDEEEMDDDDDSDEEEMCEHKGVKMFKGLQSKNKKNQKEDDEIESNENTTESDDDEDDTDEDDDKEKQKKKDDHIKKPKIRIIKNYAEVDPTVSENSDSDDYSNDTTDYSDDAELGTKALLGQSIVDDDDENFNGEDKDSSDDMYEDDSSEIEKDSENDEYDAEREANENENSIIGRFNITQKEKDDLTRRIVLIDNISKKTPVNVITELCEQYGKYQIFEAKPYPAFFLDSEQAEKIEPSEWLSRDYPHLETYSVNVLYSNRYDALKAMKYMHGKKYAGNYLNVITADQVVQEPDHAVYITNIKKSTYNKSLLVICHNYVLWKIIMKCFFLIFQQRLTTMSGKCLINVES